VYCTHCGTWAPDTDAFCTRCGSALTRADSPGAPADAASAGVAPEPGAPAPPIVPASTTTPAAPTIGPSSGWTQAMFAPLPPRVDQEFAGFWRRFASMIVDTIVLAPFLLALEISMGGHPFDPSAEWTAPVWLPINVLLTWLYSAFLESSRRQGTLGQQVLAIRVTDLRGTRISFARATGRHFAQVVSALTLGIGYLMIALTTRKQALHDKIAGCLLARAPVAS
jgi:uncharacterized RDD family membrane protein YckC